MPPLNLVGDFGGGALYLAMGICAALFEAQRSGEGQVIDCAMTDGATSLMTMFYGMKASNFWSTARGVNMLDGGAHFYDVYETADGKFVSLGSIEPQFYALLRDKAALRADWAAELEEVRLSMLGLREQLVEELQRLSGSDRFAFLAQHRGMFSRLGTTPDLIDRLRMEHGIYIIGDSRMNVAGLNAKTVPILADAIVQVGV